MRIQGWLVWRQKWKDWSRDQGIEQQTLRVKFTQGPKFTRRLPKCWTNRASAPARTTPSRTYEWPFSGTVGVDDVARHEAAAARVAVVGPGVREEEVGATAAEPDPLLDGLVPSALHTVSILLSQFRPER
jgi:hypothetical protein